MGKGLEQSWNGKSQVERKGMILVENGKKADVRWIEQRKVGENFKFGSLHFLCEVEDKVSAERRKDRIRRKPEGKT